MSASDLLAFAGAVAAGDIEVVDLTHTLSPEFPTIVMPPELGQCAPFRMEEVSRYDERGIVTKVDGIGTIDGVTERVMAALTVPS